MNHIFISYVEEDSKIALDLAKGVEQAGYKTWYYERDSLPGPTYLSQINQSIEQSQAIILVISPNSLGSNQVNSEVIQAHQCEKPFIPVLYNVSYDEFKRRKPVWHLVLAAATSVTVPQDGTSVIIPKIVMGIKTLNMPADQNQSKQIPLTQTVVNGRAGDEGSLIGRELLNGKYKIISFIGNGRISKVYAGFDNKLQRKVAIKIFAPSLSNEPYYKNKFVEEAQIAARCDHPHIVKIYEIAQEEVFLYNVMQFLPGSLAMIIEKKQLLPPLETVKILRDIADALSYAHYNSIVHKDIKPSNIMFDEHDNAMLTDFMISQPTDTTHVKKILANRPPEYMSPEQIKGRAVDFRSDLYSLGVVLYKLVTGNLPDQVDDTRATSFDYIYIPFQEHILRDRNIIGKIREILHKSLAVLPADRYQSAQEMAKAFDSIIKGLSADL